MTAYQEARARWQRYYDRLTAAYRRGEITLDDLNQMVERGEITLSRRNIIVGGAA